LRSGVSTCLSSLQYLFNYIIVIKYSNRDIMYIGFIGINEN
jgi:hypothetical protein